MPLFVIAEHIANGLLVGSYFIVLALGLSLIFSLGGVVNLAHGAFYALGAYLAYEVQLRLGFLDRKSTRLNSSHIQKSRMPSSA